MNINPTDLNYILAVLGERPYREVGALIEDLRRQAASPPELDLLAELQRQNDEAAALIEDLRRQEEADVSSPATEPCPNRSALRIRELEAERDALLKADRVRLDDDLADILDNSPDVAEGLPAWRCHKVVWADKITRVEDRLYFTPRYLIHAGTTIHGLSEAVVNNFPVNDADDLGYLVIYKDGYVSWSPTEAFEQGYTRIDA